MNYVDMRDRINEIGKDEVGMVGLFDACSKLLTSFVANRMSSQKRLEHFFADYNLMPLMIQENYLNSISKKPMDEELLHNAARFAELIALGGYAQPEDS